MTLLKRRRKECGHESRLKFLVSPSGDVARETWRLEFFWGWSPSLVMASATLGDNESRLEMMKSSLAIASEAGLDLGRTSERVFAVLSDEWTNL